MIPALKYDFEQLMTLVEETNADMMEIARELEFEVELKGGTELL